MIYRSIGKKIFGCGLVVVLRDTFFYLMANLTTSHGHKLLSKGVPDFFQNLNELCILMKCVENNGEKY